MLDEYIGPNLQFQKFHKLTRLMTLGDGCHPCDGRYEIPAKLMVRLATSVTRLATSLDTIINTVEQHIAGSLADIAMQDISPGNRANQALLQIVTSATGAAMQIEQLSEIVAAIAAQPPLKSLGGLRIEPA